MASLEQHSLEMLFHPMFGCVNISVKQNVGNPFNAGQIFILFPLMCQLGCVLWRATSAPFATVPAAGTSSYPSVPRVDHLLAVPASIKIPARHACVADSVYSVRTCQRQVLKALRAALDAALFRANLGVHGSLLLAAKVFARKCAILLTNLSWGEVAAVMFL